jgi:hypothetical protein
MDSVPQSSEASGSVVAAGVVAIVLGVLGAFSGLAILFVFLSTRTPAGAALPAAMRPALYGVWIFFLVCSLFVVATGVQVIRLRNWARISVLIIAGCMLFFGIIGIGVIFVTLYLTPMPDPSISKTLLGAVLTVTYGVPILISLWWLILFTRPRVVGQFQAPTLPGTPPGSSSSPISRFNNPECPLPVRVVGWYLASFVLFIPFLPFLPMHLPAFFLGHVFRGPAANGIYFLNFLLLTIPGIGLLLLKRWSYPLTYASQLLICANGLYSAFSPSYEGALRSVISEMNLPNLTSGAYPMLRFSRYFSLFGLVVPVAILITLFVFRRKFYEAADRTSNIAPIPPVTSSL